MLRGRDDDRGRGARKAGVVIDVGANVWMSALWFAARSDVVIACEPIPRTFAALVENVGASANRGGRDDDEGRGASVRRARGGDTRRRARDGRGMATVYAHDVGVGAREAGGGGFRRVSARGGMGDDASARDDEETTENLIAYVMDALTGGDVGGRRLGE